MSSPTVPVLGPIPNQPFDFASWQVQKPQPGQTDLLEVHVDLEGSGIPRQVCGVCAIGLYMGWMDADGWHEVLRYEAAIDTLWDHPDQMKRFWNTPNHQSAWDRIEAAKRPSDQVAKEITQILTTLREAGWKPHFFARPVGYDFREFSNFFTTQGLASFKRNVIDSGNVDYVHKEAVMTIYQNLLLGDPCPFGFGGAMDVTDINQQMRGWCQMLGIPPVDFKIPMAKVLGRSCLAHGGLQDAIDQALTYHTILVAVKDYVNLFNGAIAFVSDVRYGTISAQKEVVDSIYDNFLNARKNLISYFTVESK